MTIETFYRETVPVLDQCVSRARSQAERAGANLQPGRQNHPRWLRMLVGPVGKPTSAKKAQRSLAITWFSCQSDCL